MNVYANGFHVALKKSGDEIVINFTQNFPIFSDEGKACGSKTETVASVIVLSEVARGLAQVLNERVLPSKDSE